MKVCEDAISLVGLTLLYEPDWPIDPVVDIVLVHGIGGHPIHSWKFQSQEQTPATPKPGIPPYSIKRRLTKLPPATPLRRSNSEPLLAQDQRQRPLSRSKTLLRKISTKSFSRINSDGFADSAKQPSLGRPGRVLGRPSVMSSSRLRLAGLEPGSQPSELGADAYWPLDFLPASCPNARVFTWGYHMLVADKKPLPQQGDIFAHAGELLVELASTRAALGARARPLVFVAHSTGGVLVKELLRLSEAERDGPLKQILLSTSAVVFLGSPHRGTGHCNLGDAVRSMASVTFSADADDTVLQELCGAKSVEVELGRQTFVRLWNEYNFAVKTFQESVIPSYQDRELRAETTTRRLSSFIGDPRENAETIGALHDNICKFGSAEEPGYRALAKSLAAIITVEEDGRHVLNTKETECLSTLVHPQLTVPDTRAAPSCPGTCLWLYDLHDFQAWHHRNGPNKHKILWIRGQSGCGKTVLLRSLRRNLERQWGPAGVSFVWSVAEGYDETSLRWSHHQDARLAGVYRSLLAQLFVQDPNLRKALMSLYNQPRSDPHSFDDAQVVSFFADYYVNQKIETPARRTFVVVEIADDACPAYVHELIGRLSHLAQNSDFSICVASGYHPEIIEEENVISIPMHLRNADDILRYVSLNLAAEWEDRDRTVMQIRQKSAGVFLWAEIVVNIVNAAILEGAAQEMVERILEEAPGDLHGLYEWMLSTLDDKERAESLVLFQWVILAAEPMRLNDLFLAVRLTEPNMFAMYERMGPRMALDIGPPTSMRELRQLRNSEITSDTPYQFHRWLSARSAGLLELKSDSNNRQPTANEPLGLQRIETIHSSVRTFFLSGRGFACLAAGNPSIPPSLPAADFIDVTHYALLRVCLTYLNMRDFESFGHGASRRRKPASPSAATVTNNPATVPWHPPPIVSSSAQRHLVMSSYPLLQYAVDNLLFHLLSPSKFRYFLPQQELLATLAAHDFRLWKRWTSLVGSYDPAVILAKHTGLAGAGPEARKKSAVATRKVAGLLSPVYGARFRLERVLRKVGRLAASEEVGFRECGRIGQGGMWGGVPVTPLGVGGGVEENRKDEEEDEEDGVEEEKEEEEGPEWVPSTPRFRLPPELSLPLPAVSGSLASPVKRAWEVAPGAGVGLAV